MKLCIPIAIKPEGGMYTFLGNFQTWLTKQGIPWTSDLDADYDVLFVNSWMVSPSVIRQVKAAKPHIRVVQRVDGSAEDYGGDPACDGIQARVNLLADLTIFQSEYSRYATYGAGRVVSNDGPVIYNPVDVDQFCPGPYRFDGVIRVACASWSTNHKKGTWQVNLLAQAHPDVVFVLCGRFPDVSPRPNIIQQGHLTREQMAASLRMCDVFLNLSENDPCPNVVLEALASGLPVLYKDSGGVWELVSEAGTPITLDVFADSLAYVMRERPLLAHLARMRALSRFSPGVIFPQYMQAIESAKRKPLPSTLSVLELARQGYPVLRSPRELLVAAARRVSAWTW